MTHWLHIHFFSIWHVTTFQIKWDTNDKELKCLKYWAFTGWCAEGTRLTSRRCDIAIYTEQLHACIYFSSASLSAVIYLVELNIWRLISGILWKLIFGSVLSFSHGICKSIVWNRISWVKMWSNNHLCSLCQNQTQSVEDIRWYWAHGRDALGAGHVPGSGLVHLLLLHLEGTQVNWQGETNACHCHDAITSGWASSLQWAAH